MKKIFWDNPYQTKLDTKAIQIDNDSVLFDATIAYSFAGGQESDKAWVNDIPILNSIRAGNLIYYTLPSGHGLKPGECVTMNIDWPRRYKLMRLHFAAELILEIVTQKYGLPKIGAHISENKSRIDFTSEQNVSIYFPEILEMYNQIIIQDLPIEKGYSDIVNQRRFWKIPGFAQVPCGGTHVDTTKEVGLIALRREKPGKGVERIEIRLIEPDLLASDKNAQHE